MLDSIQHIATDSLALINAASVDLPTIPRVTNWGTSPLIGSTLIVLFLLFIVAFNQAKQFYLETLRSYFRDRERLTYEEADNTSISILFMLIIAVCTFSIFIAIAANHSQAMDFSQQSLILLGIVVALVSGWLVLQWLAFKYVGMVANQSTVMRRFIRSFITTFVVCGLLLFPIIVGMIYAPPAQVIFLLYIGLFFIGLAVILILFKAFQFFFNGFTSLCYLFLYLCTLEILPILLLKKAVVMWIANV